MTIDDDRVEQLLDELENDPDWEEHWANGGDLVWEGYPEMVEPLLDRLDVNDERTCQRAVQALGWISDDRAVEPLLRTLREDPPEDLQANVVLALGNIGSEAAAEPIRERFEPTSSYLQWAIVYALGELGAVDHVTQIYHECGGEDVEQIRLLAISSLGSCHDEQGIPELLRILDSGPAADRKRAADTLGTYRTERAFDVLVAHLKDDDPGVRAEAVHGIKDYIWWNKRDFESYSILESLRRWLRFSAGDDTVVEIVDLLLDRLDDEAEQVRQQAASTLGSIASYGIVNASYVRPALVDVRKNDSSADVRDVASTELDRLAE